MSVCSTGTGIQLTVGRRKVARCLYQVWAGPVVHFHVLSAASTKLQEVILIALGTFLSLAGLAGACVFLTLRYRGLIKHWLHSPPGVPVQIGEVSARAGPWGRRRLGGRSGQSGGRRYGLKAGWGRLCPGVHGSLTHGSRETAAPQAAIRGRTDKAARGPHAADVPEPSEGGGPGPAAAAAGGAARALCPGRQTHSQEAAGPLPDGGRGRGFQGHGG